MEFPQQFPSLTIPTGAGAGQQRITLNDNQNGKIQVYDANGHLVDSLGGPQGQFILYDASGNMVISLASAAGTDSLTGLPFQAGITAYTSTTAINLFQNDITVTASDGSKVVIESGGSAGIFFQPPGAGFFSGDIITGVSSGTPELFISSPQDTNNARSAVIQLNGTSASSNNTSMSFTADHITVGSFIDTYASKTTFTPNTSNDGGATYSKKTGYYYLLGKLCIFNVELVVSGAGSGTGNFQVSIPPQFNIDRTNRQCVTCHTESSGPNGSHIGDGQAVALASGSTHSPLFDRIRTSSNGATNGDVSMQGQDLLVGANICVTGCVFIE